MAEPDQQEAADEAAYIPWSGEEKFSFLTQVIGQTNGYSNNSEVKYDMIKSPGRSRAVMEMMWQKMKAEAVHVKKQAEAREIGIVNPDISGELAAVLKKFLTLPAEMRVNILGHVLDEPRILEFCCQVFDCRCRTTCRWSSRWDCSENPDSGCVTLQWTDQTDDVLSISTALLHVNQEARIEFMKRYKFYYLLSNGSQVALNLSQDIFYFGIGTICQKWIMVRLQKCGIQRVAFDSAWWVETYHIFDVLELQQFEDVTEIIMVLELEGNYDVNDGPFKKSKVAFHEIAKDDKITGRDNQIKRAMQTFWQEIGEDSCSCKFAGLQPCSSHRKVQEIMSKRDGKWPKLTFMKLNRSYDFLLDDDYYYR